MKNENHTDCRSNHDKNSQAEKKIHSNSAPNRGSNETYHLIDDSLTVRRFDRGILTGIGMAIMQRSVVTFITKML